VAWLQEDDDDEWLLVQRSFPCLHARVNLHVWRPIV
jgi:hypothetical protein